ncbi:cadherin-like and PC-esterase domain-containing protein 1 isoform X2 [Triplophysa rosa]|uniref:cadherin-like and PC-esterase domain-containing protein 1 isoform X2 n=1 Tax=Triplophysa rosa TaxID=992332 RepID=UPI00254622D1|nr:cadherin-like and PC-esterase domain-containing protein 1 isoform X2 [Triplophysa rosa]
MRVCASAFIDQETFRQKVKCALIYVTLEKASTQYIHISAEVGMFFRGIWTLRRRCFTGPLLLLGIAVGLFYHTVTVDRNGTEFKSDQQVQRNKSVMFDHNLLLRNPERLASHLETPRTVDFLQHSTRSCAGKAIILTGQNSPTDTEVQLYRRVLQQQGYRVDQARYAETSASLRQDRRDGKDWSVLVCLKGSEKSCLRKINFAHPQYHQRVNIIPAFSGAFLDMGGVCRFLTDSKLAGVILPIVPSACSPSTPSQDGTPYTVTDERTKPIEGGHSDNHNLNATVNIYVLVTSATPLTAFIHRTVLIKSHLAKNSYATELQVFFRERLGSVLSNQASVHMKHVVSQILTAALLTTQESTASPRCQLCFQLLTFTLHYNTSLHPVVVKLRTDLHFDGMRDPHFDGQITKETMLEDVLKLLFPACNSEAMGASPSLSTQEQNQLKNGGCDWPNSLCLPPDELYLLQQFNQHLKTSGPFQLLYPISPSDDLHHDLILRSLSVQDDGWRPALMALLQELSLYYTRRNQTGCFDDLKNRRHGETHPDQSEDRSQKGRCVDPHLRQLYTDPPMVLMPAFNAWVKEYRAEVPFDVITIWIRPEPVSPHCHIHLDEHRGPGMANYPVGLGNSRINILVTDESAAEPVVMTIYTLHIYRESRPSLPMFDEYVMCSFVQDCGLVVRPDQPCGLEPVPGIRSSEEAQPSPPPCLSGDEPGRWVVPCLSCSDNRTCDWREVTWQPDSCYHPLLDQPQLQTCMMDRKVLFIGDSTNRGMMYYLMERVNTTLEDWDKAHDTIIYHNLNQGRTIASYSYYPQFWLPKAQRPTFQRALEQLIERSRPLEDSSQTVLVAGGVQWLNLNHLRTIQQVLKSEGLQNILVVVKSLGMGFHLPINGIRSLPLSGVQELDHVNKDILENAKHLGYEVIDTFSITMGRYKEFLQGRCACHFHEVYKLPFPTAASEGKLKILRHAGESWTNVHTEPQPEVSYHVKGPVNKVYSEILLSRICVNRAVSRTIRQQ